MGYTESCFLRGVHTVKMVTSGLIHGLAQREGNEKIKVYKLLNKVEYSEQLPQVG